MAYCSGMEAPSVLVGQSAKLLSCQLSLRENVSESVERGDMTKLSEEAVDQCRSISVQQLSVLLTVRVVLKFEWPRFMPATHCVLSILLAKKQPSRVLPRMMCERLAALVAHLEGGADLSGGLQGLGEVWHQVRFPGCVNADQLLRQSTSQCLPKITILCSSHCTSRFK